MTQKEQNPKQQYGEQKVQLQLVPGAAMIAIANGLAEGAEKYGEFNWRKTEVEIMTYFGAALRHLYALMEGEWEDTDSKIGKTHLDGWLANAAIIADIMYSEQFIDNRPPPNNATLRALARHKDEIYAYPFNDTRHTSKTGKPDGSPIMDRPIHLR